MRGVRWSKGRRTLASFIALAVLVGTPATLAIIHQGWPLSDLGLLGKDVWVTNGKDLAVARLNTQIGQLTSSQFAKTASVDVLQDGENVFVADTALGLVDRLDTASVQLTEPITVDKDSETFFGGDTLAILSPSGTLGLVDASQPLTFDAGGQTDTELGSGALVAVSQSGQTFALSVADGTLQRFDGIGSQPVTVLTGLHFGAAGADLTTVGDKPVILDRTADTLLFADGSSSPKLPEPALRLQQPGPDKGSVAVATATGLLEVGFDGKAEPVGTDADQAATSADQIAAPVVVGTCVYGAWASSATYQRVCESGAASHQTIPGVSGSSSLKFRVNRDVVALNDLLDGNVWMPLDDGTLSDTISNWSDVEPPKDDGTQESDQVKVTPQQLTDTLKDRPAQNRPPVAVGDAYGARPGTSTILRVLDNDSDPDGDVLTITKPYPDIDASSGYVDVINDGRALQFTPAAGATRADFSYTVSDGRGGTARADVAVTVSADAENPPVQNKINTLTLEVGKTLTYNALVDWSDPDGDDLTLTGAVSTTGDLVTFTADGTVAFRDLSLQPGDKKVNLNVSDAKGATTTGELDIHVVAAGESTPFAMPDYAVALAGQPVEIRPLDNDYAPSGGTIALGAITPLDGADKHLSYPSTPDGVITASSGDPGTYYLEYELDDGVSKTPGTGLIRVDILADESTTLPPVAVKDVFYIHPNQSALFSPLDNDVSPAGTVIGVQSVDESGMDPDVRAQTKIQVLSNAKFRVTTQQQPTADIASFRFTYTVSDGQRTSSPGTVTVVLLPEIAQHTAPKANDDSATVRAGDIVSVDVMANDTSPDGTRFDLDPVLQNTDAIDSAGGLAFVSNGELRFQAPSTPGIYRVKYRIYDAFENENFATVTFNVLGSDTERPPQPKPLVGRVYAGSTLTVAVPLDGIDPDGDSVRLESVSGAEFGSATVGADHQTISYQARPGAGGTDVLAYTVQDALGATAVGELRIAVIPLQGAQGPVAVNDQVQVAVGTTAQVDVLRNDSSPTNSTLTIAKLLDHAATDTAPVDDVAAKIDTNGTSAVVDVTAGTKPGTYSVGYRVSDEQGLTDDAYIIVTVAATAATPPPTVQDQYPDPPTDDSDTVTVDALLGAVNPGGDATGLTVKAVGPNAGMAVDPAPADGKFTITMSPDAAKVVAFTATNASGQSATGFIFVPRFYTAGPLPTLKQDTVNVPMNGSWRSSLEDLLNVAPGRSAKIVDPGSASVGSCACSSPVVDEHTLQYAPIQDFRGTVTLTFTVSDRQDDNEKSRDEPVLQLTIIVGDPEYRDYPPSMSDESFEIAEEDVNVPLTIDLGAATQDPNRDLIPDFQYAPGPVTGATDTLQESFDGSRTLTVTLVKDPGETVGKSITIPVDLTFDGTGPDSPFHASATITVSVTKTTRPMPQAIDDAEPDARASTTLPPEPVLDNDFNPFTDKGQPLTIIAATVQSGDATLVGFAAGDTALTVRTGPTKSDTVTVIYTAQDYAKRTVQGKYTVTVVSAPEPVTDLAIAGAGSGALNVSFNAPTDWNGANDGSPKYTVTQSPGGVTKTDCTTGGCVFGGLTNGTQYTFTVIASNHVGDSTPQSVSAKPYGKPSVPKDVVASVDRPTAATTAHASWAAPDDLGGGTIGDGTFWYQFQWTTPSGSVTQTTGTSASLDVNAGGPYRFTVQACDPAGCSAPVASAPSSAVGTMVPPAAPGTPTLRESGNSPSGTITATWNAVNDGPNAVSYECSFNGGGWTACSSNVQYSGLSGGTYSFQVRAKNDAGASGASPSASATVPDPPPPPAPSVTLSAGASAVGQSGCGSAGCHFLHIEVRNFAPNTTYTAECLANGVVWSSYNRGRNGVVLTTNGSGNGGWDLQCYSGEEGSVTATYGGVTSNAVNPNQDWR